MTKQYYVHIDRNILEVKMIFVLGVYRVNHNREPTATNARLVTNAAKKLEKLRGLSDEYDTIEFSSTNFSDMEDIQLIYGIDGFIHSREI